MAILTDIIIASPEEAEAICADPQHSQRWPCLQFRDMNNMVLADLLDALWADDDAKALRGADRLVHSRGREGPWVFHLPDTLRVGLASLEDEMIPEVAERWAEGEELSFDLGFARRLKAQVQVKDVLQDLISVLGPLRDFSRQALTANKPLLLWMST